MARKERTKRTASPTVPPTPEELGLDEVDAASADSMDASDPPAFGGATRVGAVGAAAGNGGERRELIAARAYDLWREAGSPEGVALEYWLAAEREFDRLPADEHADK